MQKIQPIGKCIWWKIQEFLPIKNEYKILIFIDILTRFIHFIGLFPHELA